MTTLKTTLRPSELPKTCKTCGTTFFSKKATQCCSDECRKEGVKLKKIADSRIKFDDSANPDDYVECKECGFRSADIGFHAFKTHGLNSVQYKEKHNSPVVCKTKIESYSGENNPAYNHGGKFSAFSKNFIKYKDLTEDEINEKISNTAKTALETKVANDNNPTTIEYFIKRGYTEAEAKIALSERQSTFSLEKCIEKYGEEEGLTRWKERQEKWQATLLSKSPEEIEEINKKKVAKTNCGVFTHTTLETPGHFYLVKIDDTKCKIGITKFDSIERRYGFTNYNRSGAELLMFKKANNIYHAFQIEFLIKSKYYDTIVRGDYGIFGWSEVLHNVDFEEVRLLAESMLSEEPSVIEEQFNVEFNK